MAFARTAISTSGTLTNGSANITSVANTTGIYVGMCVYGVGIQADTVVNSIAGSTITMSKNATASGSTVITGQYITQSGTDTDPSGLSAMTGVTSIVEGTGTRLTAKYNLGTNQLRITGTLTHNPDQYCIVGNVQFAVTIEGIYNYGIEKVVNGRYSYSKGCGLDLTYNGGIASNFPIQLRSGQFNWRGGIIRFGGAFSMTGGTFNQKGDTSVAYNNNSNTQIQLRTILPPSSMVYDKIKLAGDNSTFFWTTQTYSAISANLENGAVQTPAGFSATQSYNDFVFANNQAPADFYINQLTSASSTLSIVKNPDSIPRVAQLNSGAYGVVEIRESLALSVTDANNANATNVTAYVKDSNNGARTNENQLTYTSDLDYFGTGDGAISLGDILVDVQMRNPAATTTVKHDYRGNFGTTSIDFNTYIGGYNYNNAVTRQTLIGNGGKNVGWTLFDDTNITLSRADALAKLASSFTVDSVTKTITVTANSTYDDLYDITKAHKYQGTKAAVIVPSISDLILTPNGSTLTAYSGWSLIVNNGVTLSEGVKFTYIYFDTITKNGNIAGIYGTLQGVSTTLELRDISNGSSYYIGNNSSGSTILYGTNSTGTIQSYRYYFPPGSVGTSVLVVREKYGYQRASETFNLVAGFMWWSTSDVEDVGITETSQTAANAWTDLSGDDTRLYDGVALYRLTENGIKVGQIVTRDGTSLKFNPYNVVFNDQASAKVALSSGTLTLKALTVNSTTKYDKLITDSNKTIVPTDNELINVTIEDANGDSKLTILGGDGTFELWKIPTTTATDDYATGVKLTSPTIGNDVYRFIGVNGYDIVGRDISSGVRRRSSMAKGVYTQSFYVGEQIQLAQNSVVDDIKLVVDEILVKEDIVLADLTIVNNGVKKASLLIPHTQNLS